MTRRARKTLTPEEQAEHWLLPSEAGMLLGVDGRTVLRWVKDGRLPAIRTPGGQHRLKRSDINAYLERNTTDASD